MGFTLRRQIKKRDNPEGKIQLQIIHYCKARGWKIGKTKTKGSQLGKRFLFDVYQFRGFPDLVLFTPKFYFIEVKSPTGKQSPEQLAFELLCMQAGIPYLLVHSMDELINGIK